MTGNKRIPMIALDYSEKDKATLKELMVDYETGNIYIVSAIDKTVIFDITKKLQEEVSLLNADVLEIEIQGVGNIKLKDIVNQLYMSLENGLSLVDEGDVGVFVSKDTTPDTLSVEVVDKKLQVTKFDTAEDMAFPQKWNGKIRWVQFPKITDGSGDENDGISTSVLLLEPLINKIHLQPSKRQRTSNLQVDCEVFLPTIVDEYCGIEWYVVTLDHVAVLNFMGNIIWQNVDDRILKANTYVVFRFETWDFGGTWLCKSEIRLDNTTGGTGVTIKYENIDGVPVDATTTKSGLLSPTNLNKLNTVVSDLSTFKSNTALELNERFSDVSEEITFLDHTLADFISQTNSELDYKANSAAVETVAQGIYERKQDYEYQTPYVSNRTIELERKSDTKILRFYLNNSLSGGPISISLDAGATSVPLKDVDGLAVTELSKGFMEVVYNTSFFTYAPKGGATNKINIYTQLTEPVKKEGIWVKTINPYTKVINDTELYFANAWIDPALNLHPVCPYASYESASVSIGTKLYLFGGNNSANYKKAYVYDSVTNIWSALASIPFNFYGGTAVAVGTKIYLMGGDAAFTANYVYDTVDNTYTSKTGMLNGGSTNHSAAAVGNDIHVIGGSNSSGTALDSHYVYNTITNSWTTLTDAPYALVCGTAVSIGAKIYIMGSLSVSTTNQKLNYELDTITNTWVKLLDIPVAMHDHVALTIGSNIYVIGGYGSSASNKTYQFNTLTNTWTALQNAPYAVENSTAAVIGSKIHLIGGYNAGGKTYHSVYSLNAKPFNENELIIFRNSDIFGTYYTELVTPSKTIAGSLFTRLLTGFNNVWLYNSGNLQEYPTYYGNGTQWIKFKN